MAFPTGDWTSLFCIFLCVAWYCYGLGYLISLLLSPSAAVVGATAVGLVLGGIFNGAQPALASIPDGDPMKIINQFSFTRCGVGGGGSDFCCLQGQVVPVVPAMTVVPVMTVQCLR